MKKILISIFVLFLLAGLSVGWGQASTAKAASYNSKTYAKEVVRLVNVERAKRVISHLNFLIFFQLMQLFPFVIND